MQSHTILLVQPTKRPEGRTYADYESVNECMEGEQGINTASDRGSKAPLGWRSTVRGILLKVNNNINKITFVPVATSVGQVTSKI